MKKILILSSALLLVGCATASKPGAMAADVTAATVISESSKLKDAVTVADVTGGKKTNPLWTSQVSSEDFQEALRQSLGAHAMLAEGEGKYILTAELQKLKQPFAGANMSVTSNVRYILTEVATGEAVFDEVIEEKYTAKFGDSLVAVKRLQLANEGSIKSNISNVIKMMIEKVDGIDSMSIASIQVEKIAA